MATTPLQLDAYLIDALQVEALANFDEARSAIALEMDVGPQYLMRKDDPHAHQIALSVTFGPKDEGSAPYRGRVEGRAFFHVDNTLSEEDTASYILLNGAAILFGLLRAQVAQITALGPWGTLLLPPLNLVEAFAKKAEQAGKAEQPKEPSGSKKASPKPKASGGKRAKPAEKPAK